MFTFFDSKPTKINFLQYVYAQKLFFDVFIPFFIDFLKCYKM